MNFLVDENLSQALCQYLTTVRDAAAHIRDVTGTGASDSTILEAAGRTESTIVTADTDFGTLLARTRRSRPSDILVRALLGLPADEQGRLIVANLDQVRSALEGGAIVVMSREGIRIRPLPIT